MPTHERQGTVMVLVPDEATFASYVGAVPQASHDTGAEIVLEVARGDLRDAIAHVRAVHGRVPLAVVATSERAVLDALAEGVDHASTEIDIGLAGLVRRTMIRGNARLHQERLQANVAHGEKLAALGTVVAGIAHEINNPCAAVMMSIDTLRAITEPLLEVAKTIEALAERGAGLDAAEVAQMNERIIGGGPPSEALDVLTDMNEAMHTITEVVRDLRIFARAEDNEPAQVTEVPNVVDHVLRVVGGSFGANVVVERDYSPDLPALFLPRTRLVQVITNILVNAGHAMSDVDRPVHRIRISARADDEGVVLSIQDSGRGIPADLLERVFDPFFTTKAPGVGTGLGLSLSRELVRRMGGELMVESVVGSGATFIIYFPLPEPTTVSRLRVLPEAPVVAPPRRRSSVLVVDDDERVLRAFARVLREKYDVLLATDGQEAIDLLRSGSHADAIVSDMAMPEVDGPHLFDLVTTEYPELSRRMIFVTAGARGVADESFLTARDRRVLPKPVSRDVLLRVLDEVLDLEAVVAH
jgi:signal transduction histidine kinase/ActR/RegA family two-component response regulator